MVSKPQIENEWLKKEYWVEGVGANKVYVTGQGKNRKNRNTQSKISRCVSLPSHGH